MISSFVLAVGIILPSAGLFASPSAAQLPDCVPRFEAIEEISSIIQSTSYSSLNTDLLEKIEEYGSFSKSGILDGVDPCDGVEWPLWLATLCGGAPNTSPGSSGQAPANGLATWSIGGIVYVEAPLVGCKPVPLPMIPAATDIGFVTEPYVVTRTGDDACREEEVPGLNHWSYDFTYTATLMDATYSGWFPFYLMASRVTFFMPDLTLSVSKNWDTGAIGGKELCEGHLLANNQSARNELFAQLEIALAGVLVPIDAALYYIRKADGSWLLSFPSQGNPTATITFKPADLDSTTGIPESWSFDATWEWSSTCPPPEPDPVCYRVVIMGHGEGKPLL